ncbi:MAG: NAD(P)-dependent oxidoreductase [Chloroflexi bacterium]|nr:NAD(P)-dependent oxidoreductase [Chloroflexota bacterium]
MAYLVTGLGYIGSAVAARLLADGEEVVGVDNFFSTQREAIGPLEAASRFRLVAGSLTDPTVLAEAFDGPPIDTLIQLAGQASAHAAAASLDYTVSTNILGIQQLLRACASHLVPRVVLASSMRNYALPFPRRLTERAPLNPPDMVHLSQFVGETLLGTVQHEHPDWNTRATAVRIGTVHGVGPVMKTDPHFLAAPQLFCWKAARGEELYVNTDPSAVLAFVQLTDAVEGLIHCAAQCEASLVNLATEVRSVQEVAEIVRDLGRQRGLDIHIEASGRARRPARCTIGSALENSGFRPSGRLEDSLGEVLDYYLTLPVISES